MTDLSFAAQAVLNAAYREMDYAPRRHVQWVAAALQAAVDQVVHNRVCRMELHLIAAELEGANG